MASIVLSERPLANLRQLARDAFVDVKSSHLSEALAAALGFRTHASLLAAVHPSPEDAGILLLQEALFRERMAEFSYAVPERFSFEELHRAKMGRRPEDGATQAHQQRASRRTPDDVDFDEMS
ncbi:hypothetical protein [Burkholderia cenocepacia]|uniref:hypothetical protein n=1 Tax=Burkholderia cenocepacia TaxID=95486 RepID=UPI00076DA012|nr:hypothetical protein [Burkholderia cenocepacia]KWU26424.1 hypothetical protein AS149_25895 [Burkholderia cenocepacia]